MLRYDHLTITVQQGNPLEVGPPIDLEPGHADTCLCDKCVDIVDDGDTRDSHDSGDNKAQPYTVYVDTFFRDFKTRMNELGHQWDMPNTSGAELAELIYAFEARAKDWAKPVQHIGTLLVLFGKTISASYDDYTARYAQQYATSTNRVFVKPASLSEAVQMLIKVGAPEAYIKVFTQFLTVLDALLDLQPGHRWFAHDDILRVRETFPHD